MQRLKWHGEQLVDIIWTICIHLFSDRKVEIETSQPDLQCPIPFHGSLIHCSRAALNISRSFKLGFKDGKSGFWKSCRNLCLIPICAEGTLEIQSACSPIFRTFLIPCPYLLDRSSNRCPLWKLTYHLKVVWISIADDVTLQQSICVLLRKSVGNPWNKPAMKSLLFSMPRPAKSLGGVVTFLLIFTSSLWGNQEQ